MLNTGNRFRPGGALDIFRRLAASDDTEPSDQDSLDDAEGSHGPHSGRRIGHFRVEELLGQGGMGLVYRAVDEVLGREVAIKALRLETTGWSTQAQARLLREAKALASLDHPGICRVHEMVEQDQDRFVVLELIDGRPLSDLIVEGISRDEALRLTGEIAQALAVAHDAGIAHRDLKPDNVMVQRDGKARVTDFGIARWWETDKATPRDPATSMPHAWDAAATIAAPVSEADGGPCSTRHLETPETIDLTRTGSVVGTPAYMSPEQRRGETVSGSSDVYSLGLILYEMLTGERALSGGFRTLIQSDSVEAATLSTGDRLLRGVLGEMLSPDPEKRPSARVVAERIRTLRAAPRRRRRTWALAGLGIIVATALSIAVWSTRELTSERRVFANLPRPLEMVVLPFERSDDLEGVAWAESGLRTLVTDTLAAADGVVVAPLEATRELLAAHPDASPSEIVALADAGAALAVEISESPDGYTLSQTLATADGRQIARVVEASDLTLAARSLTHQILELIDPNAVPREAHSGDPFADRLYAMASAEIQTGSDPEAIRVLLDRCLEAAPDFYRALLARAQVYVFGKRWEEAELDLQRVRQRSGSEDRELDLEAASITADLLGNQGLLEPAWRVLDSALEGLDPGPQDSPWRARLANEMALLHLHAEEAKEAVPLLLEAETIYRSSGKRLELAGVLLRRAAAFELLKRFDEGAESLDEAESLAAELGLDRRLAQIYNLRGSIEGGRGDLEAALAAYSQSEVLARKTANLSLLQALLNNRATILTELQRFDEAQELLELSLAEATKLGQRQNIALVNFNLAHLACLQGRPVEARKAIEIAHEFYGDDWDVRYFFGWIELLEDHPSRAAATLEDAKRDSDGLWTDTEEAILDAALKAKAST
ncbi:MAG: protein kinase [Thermoanaerobaculia bacterium]|nr:protein kinase [Thermoanaerobaculia bacterium]